MSAVRSLLAVSAALLALSASPASAQDRSDAEDACRDRLATRGYRSAKLDDVHFDRKGSGAVLTARMKAGRDKFDITCRVGRDSRVRDLSIDRRDGDDHGRPNDRDKPRQYEALKGADAATLDQQMRVMGYEPVRAGSRDPSYWFLASTGECLAVRMAGGRVSDVNRADVKMCR